MEKLMKMKALQSELVQDGYNITQRMIKYYIDNELVPRPVYTGKNQAVYSINHLVRLETILEAKKSGMTFAQIRSLIASSEQFERAKASFLFDDPLKVSQYVKDSLFEKELIELAKRLEDGKMISRETLEKKYQIDAIILSIITETGIIAYKETYSKEELILLLRIKKYMSPQGTQMEGTMIEKIDCAMKINSMANQIGDLLCDKPLRSAAASALLSALVEKRIDGFLNENTGKKIIIEYQNKPYTSREKNKLERE